MLLQRDLLLHLEIVIKIEGQNWKYTENWSLVAIYSTKLHQLICDLDWKSNVFMIWFWYGLRDIVIFVFKDWKWELMSNVRTPSKSIVSFGILIQGTRCSHTTCMGVYANTCIQRKIHTYIQGLWMDVLSSNFGIIILKLFMYIFENTHVLTSLIIVAYNLSLIAITGFKRMSIWLYNRSVNKFHVTLF